ncbi:inorganic pyrophosphatase [Linderina pennispora]|uniref:inorganic diphosphatase n=1 Tax=Linderina pennispora TaxID=61395 RepID=A0A1Y1WC83_9FUNG|nr:inorganic pyrophosphatase [Linderina pennispora]ORX70826.1 inorganic pyrophosphatase [Linderina pennispora]
MLARQLPKLRPLLSRPPVYSVRWHHSQFATTQLGGPVGTPTHRMYFEHSQQPISPWHDIPLSSSPGTYNMVVEVPRWSNAKLEIDTSSPFNPITQDTKNGKLRFVANVFPYKGYIWNYGALPQTFEDPNHVDQDTGCVGDGDPVDVVEIGQNVCAQGSVQSVKVLGVLALIDGGETDWKVLAIRADDPLAPQMHSIEDVRRLMPGLVEATPTNPWAFGGQPKDAKYAERVIAETHNAWRRLMDSPKPPHRKNRHFVRNGVITNTE